MQFHSVHLQDLNKVILFFNLFIIDLPMLLEKHITQPGESESPELFNTQISTLLFEDNLAIFSLIKNGLHEKIKIS